MSYRYYPGIIDKIYTAFTNGQLLVDAAHVKFSNNNVVLANATVTSVSRNPGTNYIDLIIDTKFEFNSNGGTLVEAAIFLRYYYFSGSYEYLDLCTNPGVTVGAGSTTLNQRYIIRFSTLS